MLRHRVEHHARLCERQLDADRRVVRGADHRERLAFEHHVALQEVAVGTHAVVGAEELGRQGSSTAWPMLLS